jgi:glycerophosphoryl diester phosphodiesterase
MEKQNFPLIFAHRGASGICTENTMPAFRKAIELGADGLETDVWVTKDGVPFLFHDSTLKLRNKSDPIKTGNIYFKDLANIEFLNGDSVLTLKEFLEEFASRKTKSGRPLLFSIDLSHFPVAKVATRLIQNYNCEDQIYLCAQMSPIFSAVRHISRKVHLVASNSINRFTKYTFNKVFSSFQRYHIEVMNIKADEYLANYNNIFERYGLKIFIWNLHTAKVLRYFLRFKPYAIYTNYPDLAYSIRSENKNHV